IQDALREQFRPEFLNRIEDIVIFNPLSRKDIEKIVSLQLELIEKKLKGKGFKMEFDKSIINHLSENGFDPEFGARHLKRLIQKTILDKLADKMIKGQIKDGGKIKVSFAESAVAISS
ncbi:MAG: hypothetical protein PHN74_01585, partial [Candidatus Pacebacteria bacterium]|nr:hypothetical protein [Candidatus Paceibacterota bacterium]